MGLGLEREMVDGANSEGRRYDGGRVFFRRQECM